MTKIFFTKEQYWIDKWNTFQITENRGSHLQLSFWLDSYRSYGFKNEICIVVENEEVIGGYGAVIAQFIIFKFYIVPIGPIVLNDDEVLLNQLIEKVKERAKILNCSYVHLNLPIFDANSSAKEHGYSTKFQLPALKDAEKGSKFKFVYTPLGLNWVNFKAFQTDEDFLESFKTSVRRDIRATQRKNLEFRILEDEKGFKEVYDLFNLNAQLSNYPIRSWDDFNQTLFVLTSKYKTKLFAVYLNGVIKGSLMLVWGGNYFTYMMGASSKEKPDLLTGEFLQWEAIKYSRKIGANGYNISLGGSKGVLNFKSKFGSTTEYFVDGQYYWVLKPSFFKLYLFLDDYLRKNKKKVSILLKFFNKFK